MKSTAITTRLTKQPWQAWQRDEDDDLLLAFSANIPGTVQLPVRRRPRPPLWRPCANSGRRWPPPARGQTSANVANERRARFFHGSFRQVPVAARRGNHRNRRHSLFLGSEFSHEIVLNPKHRNA